MNQNRIVDHEHTGDPLKLQKCCIPSLRAMRDEWKRQRFWGVVLVGFALMMAAVCAFVLFRIGTGR